MSDSPIDMLFARKIYPQGPEKASQFLAYLMKMAREGHLCIVTSQLTPDLMEGVNLLPASLFERYLVRDKDRIYVRRNWECENRFLTHLNRIRASYPAKAINLQALAEQGLNPEQQAAVTKASQQTLTLISGGPGTGKTYTAAVLIRLFQESGLKKIAVAAPTGKAAANIRQALGTLPCTVQTLHALLKRTPLYADLVLIDEGSMVDAELMAELFSAIPSGTRLVLLGDRDQLPPVESGHFFADLAHDLQLSAELKTCLRAELKQIIDWAAAVKTGEKIPAEPLPEVKMLIQKIMEKPIQVLTPLRKGLYGADYLNRLLFAEHQKRGARSVPIMITVNDPTLGLYNGDTGHLSIDENHAAFSGGRNFPEHILPPYEYAYALSVHKSQGSEYERVMIILPEGAEVFGREMLYTALTRAKKEVVLMAHPGVLEKLVKTASRRQSGIT